jgi:SAM-dependent methyltransferase
MTISAASRGLTFGTAAESYERFRLGVPDEVVERTLGYAGREVTRAVEVGAATGKATRAFASRGVRVAALEPDPEMFAVLQREAAGMQVTPVPSTFEAYVGPRTDLVYAAGSWHRTDPRIRWSHAADLLVEGGVLAVFDAPVRIADPDLRAAASDVRADDPDAASGPRTEEPAASGLFTDVQVHRLAREMSVSDREYVGYLSTLSTLLDLAPDVRQDVLRRTAELLPAQVRLDLTVRLLLARRC